MKRSEYQKRSRLVLPQKEYETLRLEVFTRDGWKCRVCKGRNVHCHHIVFRSHGGDDATWNLITLCNNCHTAVHDRWLLIKPPPEEEFVDANGKVVFEYVAGWMPKLKKRRAA